VGHLVLAQEAAAQLGLDEVLLVPAGEAPHKRIDPEPGKRVRLEMAELAAAGDEVARASDIEVARGGPSYTYETLQMLAERDPDDEHWFLMGADIAAAIEQWREPGEVVALAGLGIAARAGTVLDEVEAALERLGGTRWEVIGMPEIGISSTWVRRRVAQGRPIRHLVPDAVVDYIAEQGLYR
jgi:nicotinate-nucleotide adenylyltransferase